MSAEIKPPLNATVAAFGARVRARRLELEWSQEVAANHIGVHWTYLGSIERGQRSARVENVVKLAAGLRTTPGWLLDGVPAVSEKPRPVTTGEK